MTKTEKQKMLDGELYNAFDPILLAERNRAKELCFQLNQTSPLDQEKRLQLTQQILNQQPDNTNMNTDDDNNNSNIPQNPWVESPFFVDYGYNLRVGQNFYANHGCTILDCNLVVIGDNCLLAPGVCISAATHPLDPRRRAAGEETTAPITLGDNCWLGANCTLLPGVTLGDGVVVAAGAVVTPTLGAGGEPWSNVVLAGVPAKVIRRNIDQPPKDDKNGDNDEDGDDDMQKNDDATNNKKRMQREDEPNAAASIPTSANLDELSSAFQAAVQLSSDAAVADELPSGMSLEQMQRLLSE